MSFDKPQVLLGFLGFIPFIIATVYHYHKHRPVLSFFLSVRPLEKNIPLQELKVRYLFSGIFFSIFLASLLIALAGPRWGRRAVIEYHRGVDAVLAMDLSRSMEAQDTPGGTSRLDRSIQIALALAKASGGIRWGAAMGKGRGVLAVPLTDDLETLTGFLEGLSGGAITGRGTNLETLMSAASGAFQDAFPARRMIILFSDGESWSGSLSAALEGLIRREITVIALGMGTERGGAVPQSEGEPPAVSYRRGESLRTLAERTGGLYVDGNREDAAELLTQRLQSFSPQSGAKGYHIEAQAQWRVFVILALLSLGGSKLLEKRLRKHD